MHTHELEAALMELAAPGPGILPADESSGNIEKSFMSVKVPCTEGTWRQLRESSKWKPLNSARN